MQLYSNAFLHEETGDVVGYELAIRQNDDSTVDALFFVYEGAPNERAIPLSGRVSGKNLTIKGNWIERLVEYPSKKEIVQAHIVKIDGTLDSKEFRGGVKIEDMVALEKVRSRRVQRVWLCQPSR